MIKKIHLTLIAAILITTLGFAQVKSTVTKSSVTFKIKNLGINTSGSFGGLQASIDFKPADLATSSMEASVETATVNSDNSLRDDHLKNADYFDVTKYPRITFKSVSFKHKSGDKYTGIFNVTIKDKTKQIEVPFSYTETSGAAIFDGTFKILRSDFGVGGKSMVLSDEATVTVNAGISK